MASETSSGEFRTVENLVELLKQPYRVIRGDRRGEAGVLILSVLFVFSIIGPLIAPFGPLEKSPTSLAAPSSTHLLGTTLYGRDIFSQLLYGLRPTLLVGLLTGVISVSIGTTVGVVSGYYGGYVDEVLMRFTDVVYGIPLLPFAIVALTLMQRSLFGIILIIGIIYWRNSARIIRSDVLSIKEEEFVQRAKTTGASNFRIIYKQILPNVLPISFLYFAFSAGFAIVMAANIAFLGFGDPDRITWGRMIFSAWNNNAVKQQPLWVAAPAFTIMLAVTSMYLIGRTYEEVANPQLRD